MSMSMHPGGDRADDVIRDIKNNPRATHTALLKGAVAQLQPYNALKSAQVATGAVATSLGSVDATATWSAWILQAAAANSAPIYVGDAAAQYHELTAGDQLVLPVSDGRLIYVRSAAAQTLNVTALRTVLS